FHQWIQQHGALGNLVTLDPARLTTVQENIQANARLFLARLEKLGQPAAARLATFLLVNTYLVVVTTPDLDSAYRIFSVMNERGLDLTAADILKAEVIGSIAPQEQDAYTKAWEDIEEELESPRTFDEVLSHIRMIFLRSKLR